VHEVCEISHQGFNPKAIIIENNDALLSNFLLPNVLEQANVLDDTHELSMYLAPEVVASGMFRHDKTKEADMWAFGVLLFRMATGVHVWNLASE
jgi:serine/threonine protein kinase